MLFDQKNYPNLFIRGKSVNLWCTNIIRENHAYNQGTKRLRDSLEGESLYFMIVTFGKYSANGRNRQVILQFKFFPTDRALSIWIMFTVGTVDRYVDRYIGRRSGRHSIDTRSTVDRHSIDCRSTLGRLSIDTRSTLGG